MTNREWYERACRSLVGGVNSPVRAWGAVGGTPRFFLRGRGAVLEDAEGREVLDYVCSWGPLILGHACPEVVRAVGEAAGRSTSFGAPCPGEVELAEAVKRRFPSIEKIRFVSSGTEATMTALRLQLCLNRHLYLAHVPLRGPPVLRLNVIPVRRLLWLYPVVQRVTQVNKLHSIQLGILVVTLASQRSISGRLLPRGVNIGGAEKPHLCLSF